MVCIEFFLCNSWLYLAGCFYDKNVDSSFLGLMLIYAETVYTSYPCSTFGFWKSPLPIRNIQMCWRSQWKICPFPCLLYRKLKFSMMYNSIVSRFLLSLTLSYIIYTCIWVYLIWNGMPKVYQQIQHCQKNALESFSVAIISVVGWWQCLIA